MQNRISSKFTSTFKGKKIAEERRERILQIRKEFITNLIESRREENSDLDLKESIRQGPQLEETTRKEKEEVKDKKTILPTEESKEIEIIRSLNKKIDMKKLIADESYMDYIANSSVKGVIDRITKATLLGGKDIKRVYYTNSLQGGHARVIVEILNNIHISFSYGQSGGRDCFLKEGVLTIEIFSHFPDAVPGVRECEWFDLKEDRLTVGKAISIAKLIFQNDNFIEFNYWKKNCYLFADKLFFELTGNDKYARLGWFIAEVARGNKWVSDPSRLEFVYGRCPYKN